MLKQWRLSIRIMHCHIPELGHWQSIGDASAATDVPGEKRGTVSFRLFRAHQLLAKITAHLGAEFVVVVIVCLFSKKCIDNNYAQRQYLFLSRPAYCCNFRYGNDDLFLCLFSKNKDREMNTSLTGRNPVRWFSKERGGWQFGTKKLFSVIRFWSKALGLLLVEETGKLSLESMENPCIYNSLFCFSGKLL